MPLSRRHWNPRAERRAEAERAVAQWYADYTTATADLALVRDQANIAGALEWAQTHGKDALVIRLYIGIQSY
jgi:hypothetical protein